MTRRRNFAAGPAALALILAVLAAGACREPKYPDGVYAEVLTNKGLIVIRIEFERTPMTAANFVGLAEGTIENAAFPPGRPFFDGTKWHRVVPGHVIQGGVPQSDEAQGPGYRFPNEIRLPELNHGRAGMVNMANGGPHTNASQWCITLGDRSYLDGDFTVWGEVIEGMETVTATVQGDEILTVRIVRIGKAAEAFRPTTASFRALMAEAEARVAREDTERKAREEDLIRSEWPGATETEDGVRQIILEEGRGRPAGPGAMIRAAYLGRALLTDMTFASTAEDGKPYRGETAEPFDFIVGTTRINPAVDSALASMRKGEKRVVIVPAALGYGAAGYYARQREGEKRFVISPGTLLVYEIEIL